MKNKNISIFKLSIIISSILIFLFLVIIFFWREEYDINKRINSEKISHFFSIIGTFATSITVYLLYKQVKEMVDGRNLAYQPILYINKNEFLTEDISNPKFDEILKSNDNRIPIVSFYKIDALGIKQILEPSPSVSMKNIGLGVARNIKIQWIYNIEEVKTYVKGSYDEEQFYCSTQSIDFVSVNDYFDIFLPYGYMQSYGFMLNITELDLLYEEEISKPAISLILTYKNIYGKEYVSSFIVNINAKENKISINFNEVQK